MSSRKKNIETTNSQNRIGHGTVIEGDITSDGGFRIDGTLKGSVTTEGKVVIGKDGTVEGSLTCSSADIEGSFMGKMSVKSLLTLKSTARIEGEVLINKLAVEPGAVFNASCSMNNGVKTLNESGKNRKLLQKDA